MGVIHKLKPEVLSFIIENKQNNPALSCRHLTSLILDQLHIKVSKSSINAIFKENNLSMPIGRRRKQKKKKFNMPILPVIEDIKSTRLGDLPQKIIQEQEKERIEEEKAAQELAKIKALEEARLRELERLAQEAAENKRKEEEAHKLEEEKATQELARIKALEEVRLHELEKAAQEAEEKRKQEAQAHKLEEEKAAQELAKIKALEEVRLRELEKATQELARIKALEEVRLHELEKAAQEAEEKRKQEAQAHKLEEEKAAQELAKIKALEEARLRELERLAQEAAENKRKEEEAYKLEEEKAGQDAELKAEREKWAKLAENEQRSKQQVTKEETTPPKVEPLIEEVLPEERVGSGAIILKALDCLIGGSKEINALISRAIGSKPEEILNLTEALIFKSLFGKDNFSTLGDLIGVRFPSDKLNSYYAQIKQVSDIGADVTKVIADVFTEAKGVKVHFVDGSVIYLDAQLHSTWPSNRFPYDFSNFSAVLKDNLNKSFMQGEPLVLFSPSGFDILPKDFFSLLLNISSKDNYPDALTLFGNQSEDMESFILNKEHKPALIFGLWPWQFTSSRKVKKIGSFDLKHIKELDRDLYLGEIEIDLFRAALNQNVTLKGCAVKTDLKEKIRLVILNSSEQAMGLEELAGIYLSHWPNFEEAFQDFSRKIELFTYAGAEGKFFTKDSFNLDPAGLPKELTEIFANYIRMLDAYLRWHFLPVEYSEKDFSSSNDCFYKIPAKFAASQDRVKVKTLVSQEYQYLKDLEYLNCRLNERQISSAKKKVFWFESAFK